jgi:hypothetical protein
MGQRMGKYKGVATVRNREKATGTIVHIELPM